MKLFEVTNTNLHEKICKIVTHKSVSTPHIVLTCALQFTDFLRLCLSPRITSRTISFSISNRFGFNLIPFFDIGSVLAVLCWSMRCLLGPLRGRNCPCLWLWQLGFRLAAGCQISPSPPTRLTPSQTEAEVCSTMGESTMSSSFYNPTLSANKLTWKFAALRIRLPPILQTVRVSVEPRLSTATHKAETALKLERSLSRAAAPKSLPVSRRYHGSNSVVFVHRAGALAKEYPLSKLFSSAELLPFEQEQYLNWSVLTSSCLKHAKQMLLGDPRQADQRRQSFNFSIVIHQ